MKRWLILFLTLALLLAGCAAEPAPVQEQAASPIVSEVDFPEHDTLPEGAPDEAQPEDAHTHALATEDNTVEHEFMGYCGNTVTTVSPLPEGQSVSFWGDDSVELTDLLLFLDYRAEAVCSCPAEYTVTTEFGGPYWLNLTEGFVRTEDGQVSLTAEQQETVREILRRAWEQLENEEFNGVWLSEPEG